MMSHSICFQGELRKILCGIPLLPGALTDNSGMFFISSPGAYSMEGHPTTVRPSVIRPHL